MVKKYQLCHVKNYHYEKKSVLDTWRVSISYNGGLAHTMLGLVCVCESQLELRVSCSVLGCDAVV